MHPSLNQLNHRPWPLASQKWKWQQSWLDLGFFHYRKQLLRVEVHHAQWPLQRCEVEIESCDILAAACVTTLDNAPITHFSSGVEVISFGAETIRV